MLKIYFAGKYENKFLIKSFVELLKSKFDEEIICTSRWLYSTSLPNICTCARIDFEDINNSDFVIGLFPMLSGACSELGYALGSKKKCFYYIDPTIYLDENYNPIWGETNPLFSGLLTWPYIKTDNNGGYEFKPKRINRKSNGCIVHSIDDLVIMLKEFNGNSLKDSQLRLGQISNLES